MTETTYHHRWVPGSGARTFLLLHGTGGDETDLLSLGPLLDPTASWLSPRGDVLEHGAARFFRRLAEGVFDEADLRRAAAKLTTFIRDSAAAYHFDAAQLTAVGFSNGANIAAAVMLLHPGVIPSAILLRAMVPLVPAVPPSLSGSRVFLAAGRTDPIVPGANTEALAAAFRDAGAAVTLHWSAAGHNLTRGDVDAASLWLRAASAAPS